MLAIFIISATATGVLLLGGFVLRKRLAPATALAATAAVCVAQVAALLSGFYLLDGPAIVSEGAGTLGVLLPDLEDQIAADSPSETSEPFHVWVLGDSTYQSRGKDQIGTVEAMREALHRKGISGVRIDGFHSPGFNAYEFYFLLNLLATDRPNLVIMPLNLRSFGRRWNDGSGNRFPIVERYCDWRQISAAVHLSSPTRRIAWTDIILRKLDWMWFDSKCEAYLNGLKLRGEDLLNGNEGKREGAVAHVAKPERPLRKGELAKMVAEYQKQGEAVYESKIKDDHPLIGVLHEIDRFAFSRGIGIMYYTVQTSDERAVQGFNFTTLRWALADDPGVRFIEMLHEIPDGDFADFEHLYAPGIRRVASRLVDEAVAARDDAEWRASLSPSHP